MWLTIQDLSLPALSKFIVAHSPSLPIASVLPRGTSMFNIFSYFSFDLLDHPCRAPSTNKRVISQSGPPSFWPRPHAPPPQNSSLQPIPFLDISQLIETDTIKTDDERFFARTITGLAAEGEIKAEPHLLSLLFMASPTNFIMDIFRFSLEELAIYFFFLKQLCCLQFLTIMFIASLLAVSPNDVHVSSSQWHLV